MSYSFEYIDIILLAMIAGFIFLRLRGILGKRTGFEGKAPPQFEEILKNIDPKIKTKQKENFDQEAQKDFLKFLQTEVVVCLQIQFFYPRFLLVLKKQTQLSSLVRLYQCIRNYNS